MNEPSQTRRLSFPPLLVGSYVLAVATAIIASISWIEGFVWVGGIVFVAWLALICWTFSRFGARANWTLLGFLVVNPPTIFFTAVTYACAVKSACL